MPWRPPRSPDPLRLPLCSFASGRRLRPLRHASTLSSRDQSIAATLATVPNATSDSSDPIRVTGSVRTVRKQKRRCFVELGDGSTARTLQAILEPHQAEGLGTGTSVTLTGIWQSSPPGKEQPCELQTQEVRILGPTDSERYPLQKKYHTAEYLRTIPHLKLRTPLGALLARLRSESDFYFASYFRSQSYLRVQPPIITSSDCEGAGEVFAVSANAGTQTEPNTTLSEPGEEHFFRCPKYLTVSSQLHLEAFVHDHARVWAFSPTFRAEKSDTPRHVSEFWMLEAEMRTESLSDVMGFVEDMVRTLITNLRSSSFLEEILGLKRRDDVESEEGRVAMSSLVTERWNALTMSPWPRVSYADAMKLLQSAATQTVTFHHPPMWKGGLQSEHEKFIAAHVGNGAPVFVTHYPRAIKPFYMLPSERDNAEHCQESDTAECFDLLLPDGCEVVGGSLREHRLEPLIRSMNQQTLNVDTNQHQSPRFDDPASLMCRPRNLDWYADLRRYGSVPHGGFGLGFDRLISYIAGVHSIKDVVPWPRYYGRCDC